MAKSNGVGVGWEYWLQWQVPVCALIFVVPTLVAVILVNRVNREPLNSGDLWIPCWRNLNPLWLLFYRAFAFTFMALLLYQILALDGAFAFYFYTQWTFTLVMIYFALGTIISARGCWMYSRKPLPKNGEKDEFLKKDWEENGSETSVTEGTIKLQSRYNQEEFDQRVWVWEYLMQAIYQTCAGAVILTDIVFWCIIVPFLTDENFHVNLLMGCMHTLNAVFLLLDSTLNSLPFPWYRLAYFVLWSVLYVVFQWVLHACGSTWWPYSFLELSTPWAPLWYFGLALVHIPCYGLYALLIKAKSSFFSRIFPHAFVRSN
uniref:Transmembrane protein n=1 Tax=Davidia involucrata TaxID=16924 RepID=A0A5B7BU88_DAVIN